MAGCHVIDLSLCAIFETKDVPVFRRLEFFTASEMRKIEMNRRCSNTNDIIVGVFASRYDDVGGGIVAAKQKLLVEAKKRKNLNWIWNFLPESQA